MGRTATLPGTGGRKDGRQPGQLRPVSIRRGFLNTAEGSVLIEMGQTKVICTATLEEKVPPFLKDQKKGWVTAEYGMLPRSTPVRMVRESAVGKVSGRTQEIQRLIGRALRAVVDLEALGERTIWIDCDVIQADGGTRTASITGAYVCLLDIIRHGVRNGLLRKSPVIDSLAAVSVGVINGVPVLDLCYEEDSAAEVDMNVVMTGSGTLVEVQGTAEGRPFSKEMMDEMILLAGKGIRELIDLQQRIMRDEGYPLDQK